MVAIETPYGRFEAETIKEAQREARKAEREARKRDTEREERRKLAELRADSNGFRILTAVLDKGDGPIQRWWYQSASSRFLKIRRGEYGDTLTYECEHGTADYDHNGYRIVGVLSDAGGHAMAVFTRCADTGREDALAVSAEGDVLAFSYLPDSVRPECFRDAEQD